MEIEENEMEKLGTTIRVLEDFIEEILVSIDSKKRSDEKFWTTYFSRDELHKILLYLTIQWKHSNQDYEDLQT